MSGGVGHVVADDFYHRHQLSPTAAARDRAQAAAAFTHVAQQQEPPTRITTAPGGSTGNQNNDDDDDEDDDEDGDYDDGDGAALDDSAGDATYVHAGDGDVSMVEFGGVSRRRGRGKYLKPKPLLEVLTRVITALIRRDTYGFFTDPVDPAEVPGYAEAITNPLDFGTIQDRVNEESYTDVASFTADVELVFRNAKRFNAPDTIYYSEADRIETWFHKKIALEGPSAILPEPGSSNKKGKSKVRMSTARGSSAAAKDEGDNEDDDDNEYDSGNEDSKTRASASVAGSQRGARTASPEAVRPPNKRRKLNSADDPGNASLASLLGTSGGFVGLPGPNTAFAKSVAYTSAVQGRWRIAAAAASLCTQREAHFPLRPNLEPNLLRPLLERAPQPGVTPSGDASEAVMNAPMSLPLPVAGDDALAPVNPLQALRKLQYHPDGSVKVPGYTTAAQGWPDLSEAYAMNLLPSSNALQAQMRLPLAPPRVQALFPVIPLPAPPDAVTTATGRALPVPLNVGGTSALNASTNLSSATFAAAQQTPYTSSGNPFPTARNENAILKPASLTATLMPHPVPLHTTFSHEVGMRTNGGQSTFGPGQGADGGPWLIPSGGPSGDPETTSFATPNPATEEDSRAAARGEWWNEQKRNASALPSRWALPGLVPYSTGSAGGSNLGQSNGFASPASPSTPARGLPPTPLGLPANMRMGSPSSPAASLTQPSTPLGAPTAAPSSSAHGWAQRASKGREKERERESDLRDWTITRPVLERALAFEDVGGVWAEVRARMALAAPGFFLRTMEEAREKVIALGAQLAAAQAAGRVGEVQALTAQVQVHRNVVNEVDRLLPYAGRAANDAAGGRFLGRYDFVEGEQLVKVLEHSMRTEPAERLWARILASRDGDLKAAGSTYATTGPPELRFKQTVQSLVDDVQQGLWGGVLGEAYASSVARFVVGAKQSVVDWADAVDMDGAASDRDDGDGDAEDKNASAMADGSPDEPSLEKEQESPLTKRDYNDEDYLGGGLRVLLVPPRDEHDEDMGIGNANPASAAAEPMPRTKSTSVGLGSGGNHPNRDSAEAESNRHPAAATSSSTTPIASLQGAGLETRRDNKEHAGAAPGSNKQHENDSAATDPQEAQSVEDLRHHQHRRGRRPHIRRDARALETILFDDILDPLTGGLLSVVQLAGRTVLEAVELVREGVGVGSGEDVLV
ncbi:pre-mRNA-splicing factor prp46 [Tilletia horrida]|uniref:Pre-mRNA-splicing factor prp46 n=1 Tax=Tilletia horrida TaxID=155126 RepID=A0AAN6GFT2_9BASI|nr:pre-mRNA-splicing factor prp46 [Tilletia horrida]